jgi:hypothetical protein
MRMDHIAYRPFNFLTVHEALGILEDIFVMYGKIKDDVSMKKIQQMLSEHHRFFIYNGWSGNIYKQNWNVLMKIYEELKYTKEVFVYDIPGFEFVGV